MSELGDELKESVGSGWAKIIGIILALACVYVLSALIFGLWPFSAVAGVAAKVVNSEAIISNYQWYYDQFNAIESQKANYNSMDNDAKEKNGLRMVLNNMIGEYNSKSKQITRNLWKAKDLPYQIDFVGGEK